MPIYMDRHYTEGATQQALADAHEKDLNIQAKYGVKFITYWLDEIRSTAFCLVDAPSKEAIQKAHNEAHGNVANEIIEVDPSIVEAFLGRVEDPVPSKSGGDIHFDSAFRVIMFTDLKDSTKMTSLYGDTNALNLIHIHNVLTRDQLKKYKGVEIKHTGDGIMASFTDIPNAIHCAIEIQNSFKGYNEKNNKKLYLKIGLSAGEPIEEHGDLFGHSVQLAARLCSYAKPNQILLSEEVEKSSDGFNTKKLGEVSLKGFENDVKVFEVS